MPRSLPVVAISPEFTTTGIYDPFKSGSVLVPLTRPVSRWEMQVSGLSALNAAASLTSWDILLLGSLDGIYFPDTSLILEHVNTVQANGDVIWPTVSSVSPYRDVKYIRIKVKALVLNAATKIRVSVRGF